MLCMYSLCVFHAMKDKAFTIALCTVYLLALVVVAWDTKEVNRQYAAAHPPASHQPVVTAAESSHALTLSIGAVEFEMRIK